MESDSKEPKFSSEKESNRWGGGGDQQDWAEKNDSSLGEGCIALPEKIFF